MGASRLKCTLADTDASSIKLNSNRMDNPIFILSVVKFMHLPKQLQLNIYSGIVCCFCYSVVGNCLAHLFGGDTASTSKSRQLFIVWFNSRLGFVLRLGNLCVFSGDRCEWFN